MGLELYDRAFFEWHVPRREAYEALGLHIERSYMPKSVLDIGCGNGYLLGGMTGVKRRVGIDWSPHAKEFIPDGVQFIEGDLLSIPHWTHDWYDLVICMEVAEHLDETHAFEVVHATKHRAANLVIFSAAFPGQGGHGHVNEQPMDYWIEKFNKSGLDYSYGSSMNLRRNVPEEIGWLKNTLMVFWRRL